MKYNNQSIKNKIKTISNGDSNLSFLLLRLFFMENFLKRIAYSKYKDNFILKGGLLVTQEIGINSRVTKDIDATLKFHDLNVEAITAVMNDLINIDLNDDISYSLKGIEEIMDEHEYPGMRVFLIGRINNTVQPFQIDISTNDIITPKEIEYQYKLLFEDSIINVLAYNIETLLAEKIETILDRNITNTRMRDFYDVYMIYKTRGQIIDFYVLKNAFNATMKNRGTLYLTSNATELIDLISNDEYLNSHWNNYKNNNTYVGNTSFSDTMSTLSLLLKKIDILK